MIVAECLPEARRSGDRHAWKTRLVRGLNERGFSAKDVRELFHLIDWLMELPPLEVEPSGPSPKRREPEGSCRTSYHPHRGRSGISVQVPPGTSPRCTA